MLFIRVEAAPGDRIATTANDMVSLARRLDEVMVVCEFNEVLLFATRETLADDIVRRYHTVDERRRLTGKGGTT